MPLSLDDRQKFESLLTEHANASLDVVRATGRRHDALHRLLDYVNKHESTAQDRAYHDGLTTRAIPPLPVGFTPIEGPIDTIMREFVGWLSADIPALHRTVVPEIVESLERFKKMRAKEIQTGQRPAATAPLVMADEMLGDSFAVIDVPDFGHIDASGVAVPFPLPEFNVAGYTAAPSAYGLAMERAAIRPDSPPTLAHDFSAPSPQDRCVCTACNEARAKLRTVDDFSKKYSK